MSFIGTGTKYWATGNLNVFFNDIAAFNNITIYKQPIESYSSINLTPYNGYELESVEKEITYTPVYQTFSGFVNYQDKQNTHIEPEIHSRIPEGGVRIKIKQDAKDYLENGKTERIEVNGQSFNLATSAGVQNYLGLKFFVFHLTRTL